MIGADRERGDRHSFENAMRIAFEHRSIHERAGVPFVRITDDVLAIAGRFRDGSPLESGRIAGAAASTQAALRHFLHNFRRRPLVQHAEQRSIAARRDVLFHASRIDASAILQHNLVLALKEGRVRRNLQFLHDRTGDAFDDR